MEETNAAKPYAMWNVQLNQYDEPDDPAWLCDVLLFVVINEQAVCLRGLVIAYDDDPPFVERITLNELLLPVRQAQRLLRRLFEYWHGGLDGGVGMGATFNLEEWLRDHYDDGGKEVMGFIQTTLRTFV